MTNTASQAIEDDVVHEESLDDELSDEAPSEDDSRAKAADTSHQSLISDFVDVALGEDHVVALREDGTVVAAGSSGQGRLNVGKWRE